MPVTDVVDGIIRLLKQNLIAKTNVVSNVVTGDVLVYVENSFHMEPDQEIVLIDYNYNVEGSAHYQTYEYAKVKEVNNTHTITLYSPVQSDWLVSDNSFVQKTIGHAPMYDENILYGDREVIPTEDMAITVQPLSLSNEWLYIQGGLSEEYRMSITVFGKDIETEEGNRIVHKYSDAIYKLLNTNIHLDINNHESPLLYNAAAGSYQLIVEDNADNRKYFLPLVNDSCCGDYEIQDNVHVQAYNQITSVSYSGGEMFINLRIPLEYGFNCGDYAIFRRHMRYFYDSRIDNVDYGKIQKGSAWVRAALLTWFGKEVQDYPFPQFSKDEIQFTAIDDNSSSSSSGG